MPTYETAENIRQEKEVACELGRAWNCDMSKLPPFWSVDWVCERNDKVIAFLEIKCRKKYSYRFMADNGGLFIDLRKIVGFKNLKSVSGLPSALCVRLDDGIYFWEYADIKFDVRMRGRLDRENGIEACAMIPIELFRKVTHQSRNEASPETSRPATSRSGSSLHPT